VNKSKQYANRERIRVALTRRFRRTRYLNNSGESQAQLADIGLAQLTLGTIALRVFHAIRQIIAHPFQPIDRSGKRIETIWIIKCE